MNRVGVVSGRQPVGGIRVVELPRDHPAHQQPPVVHDRGTEPSARPEAARSALGRERPRNGFPRGESNRLSANPASQTVQKRPHTHDCSHEDQQLRHPRPAADRKNPPLAEVGPHKKSRPRAVRRSGSSVGTVRRRDKLRRRARRLTALLGVHPGAFRFFLLLCVSSGRRTRRLAHRLFSWQSAPS